MRISTPHWRLRVLVALVAAGLSTRASAQASVAIVEGADDPVSVTVAGKTSTFFRLQSSARKLLVQAQGPVVLSLRVRGAGPGTSKGILRIVRDDTVASDNAFELEADREAEVEVNAAIEGNAASAEKTLHYAVSDGTHRLSLAVVDGGATLLRVLKAAKLDPTLAAAPEKAIPKEQPKPAPKPEVAERPKEKPKKEEPVLETVKLEPKKEEPPVEALKVPPKPEAPGPTISRSTSPDDVIPTRARPRTLAPADVRDLPAGRPAAGAPTAAMLFIEAPREIDEEQRWHPTGGLAAAVHLGALVFAGSPAGVVPDGTHSYAVPFSLELAYDLDARWSLFGDAGYYATTRAQDLTFPQDPEFKELHATTSLAVLPLAVGFTRFVPVAGRLGLRVRFAGLAARCAVSSTMSAAGQPAQAQPERVSWGLGGLAGASLELALWRGRATLEGRWLAVRTDLGLPAAMPNQPFNSQPGELGGGQLLVGYRFEL